MSHAIASMERRLGVRLFNRTTRSVSLTEAGEQFLARVQPALREIADAVESVNRFRDTPPGCCASMRRRAPPSGCCPSCWTSWPPIRTCGSTW
uniref:LysR family transcriptional regulator n=1 Tax=Phenylobacterium glaciei TaxID=2803784 RepID=A0A974SAT0_9CAUL|nr:LysR family transcriptional regulator [Phenylobacterium glaciei]